MNRAWFIGIAGLALGASMAGAQRLTDVPGTVVYWRGSPISRLWPSPDRIYTASPSIAVLPGGEYLIAFNLFGGSLKPPAETSGTTFIYRSGDKGLIWTNLTPRPLMNMKRGSLFVRGEEVFLWGYTSAAGSVILRKSSDRGASWSDPADASSGLLLMGGMGGTTFNPVEHGGRLWMAQGGKRVLSVSNDRDPMHADAWVLSRSANLDRGPFGSGKTITEAQIVAAPHTGVVLMPKIKDEPMTVLIRMRADGRLMDPSPEDWVDLPGGDKKFGAGYDPVSKRFFVVSNPVLPAHADHAEPPNMIRNTAALLSSPDLRRWTVEQLFLYSPRIDCEGFQYLNFDVDDEDMVVASRTAFDLTGEPGIRHRPPRAHDSNLITFHRIERFREARPRQFLECMGGRVFRFEKTQHAPAPLGEFSLGPAANGDPLSAVEGIARGLSGDVLLRERSGRVVRFDAFGNDLGPVASAGAVFASRLDPVDLPASGERGWIRSTGGAWSDLSNWFYWNRPDGSDEIAVFGSAIEADATVTLDRATVLGGLRFRCPRRYTVAGEGPLVLDSPEIASIEVLEGRHEIGVAIRLDGNARISIAAGAHLHLSGELDLNGHTVRLCGPGELHVTPAIRNVVPSFLIEEPAPTILVEDGGAVSGQTGRHPPSARNRSR